MAVPSDLTSQQLALVRGATTAAPGFAVWKNVEAGLAGTGDLDAVAPAIEWPLVVAEHRRWALSQGLGSPLECRHVPGLLVLVAFSSHVPGSLLQLDVATHLFVQGAPVVPVTRLGPLLRMDARGFRALRPGAEGLFKLVQSATRSGKPASGEPVDATVAELLARDPDGVQSAAQLLDRAGPAAQRAARAALAARWDRDAMAEVAGWCSLAALRRPLLPARRIAAGLGPIQRCPLIAALANGRRVSGSPDRWLAQVAATHPAPGRRLMRGTGLGVRSLSRGCVSTIGEGQRSDDADGSGELSVVIVSHDTRKELRRCLDAIGSGSSDVIVVDSGSSDGSVALVSSAYPQVRLIALDNVGFGAAANAGIASSRGRHVLLLNADARSLPGALARLVAVAQRHPDAGMIGPRLRTPDGSVQRSVFASPRGPISLAAWVALPGLVSRGSRAVQRVTAPFRRQLAGAPPVGAQEVVGLDYVQGSAVLLRRDALDAVGGFDERFFMYCEEADLCYRLRQAGWSTLFTPECEFVHVGGASTGQCADDMYGELMRAHVLLLAKHQGSTAGERARRLVVLAMRVRAAIHVGARRRRYAAACAALASDNQLGLSLGA